jgi:formate hydrogenlyase subunit 6/NADH:ubiquinone oxidoreductase subunit I
MLAWIWRGLRTGIVTTRYPKGEERMPDTYRGRVVVDQDRCDPDRCAACVTVCLPRAITVEHGVFRLDSGRCITCGYCIESCPAGALRMRPDFEIATRARTDLVSEVRGVVHDDHLGFPGQ